MTEPRDTLYTTEALDGPRPLRTLIAYVEDRPGVLDRIASLFRRRAYNIESLTVARTHRAGVSRITLVVEADAARARLVEANLYKLVNVLYVEDITHAEAVVRDLALIKVRADARRRPEILQLCEVFRARVVDVAPDALTVEITGTKDKIDGLLEVLRPYDILEMVQTGAVAMTRGSRRRELDELLAPRPVSEPPGQQPDDSEAA
jgi:acetolactate synthase I/III small subunit